MRRLLTYGLFPATFGGALAVAWLAIDRGWSHPATLAAISASVAVLVAVFERIHPAYAEWNRSREDVGVDALHTTVSMVILPKLLEIGVLAGLLRTAQLVSHVWGDVPWPEAWPLPAQLGLALLISQFVEYWVHRLMHERPLLWRLHATHHSPHRLYWLNAGRFHPLDTALSYTLGVAPLTLMSVPPDVLLLLTTWIAVHGMFQHCNVKLRLGPLNYLFSMAELHRWHHSKVLAEANNNYGNNIILWDLIFGTFFWPRDRDPSPDVGLSDLPDFPQDYVGQLLSPWRWPAPSGNAET